MYNIKNFNLEVKSSEDEGIIKFYGAIFGNRDSYNDIIVPGAFKKTLEEKGAEKIKFLFNHNTDNIIGKILNIQEDEHGLLCEAKMFLDTQEGKEKFLLLKEKQIDSFSIGYIAKNYEVIIEKKEKTRYLKDIDLFEISLVLMPANEEAKLLSLKSVDDLICGDNYDITDQNTEFCEEVEREKFKNCLGITDLKSFELDGKLIFSYNEGNIKLNYKAVSSLDEEIKQNNPLLIAKFYDRFRKEYKDNSLFSNVCNKSEIIAGWSIKDFDSLLKHNGFKSQDKKAFYNRLAEIKASEYKEEIKELKEKIKKLTEKKEYNYNNNLIEGIDY